jgi:hypothetical protein
MTLQGRKRAVLELPYTNTREFAKLLKFVQFTLEDEMDKKINSPSDAVSEEMKAQLNKFQHTVSHGFAVVKHCMKEGNDTTTTKFHTFKGVIDLLITNDGTQEISSAISTIMEKRMGATLPTPTTKKKKRTPVTAASPNNTAQPPEVACATRFVHMLEPTVATEHMAAASPTINAHIL